MLDGVPSSYLLPLLVEPIYVQQMDESNDDYAAFVAWRDACVVAGDSLPADANAMRRGQWAKRLQAYREGAFEAMRTKVLPALSHVIARDLIPAFVTALNGVETKRTDEVEYVYDNNGTKIREKKNSVTSGKVSEPMVKLAFDFATKVLTNDNSANDISQLLSTMVRATYGGDEPPSDE